MVSDHIHASCLIYADKRFYNATLNLCEPVTAHATRRGTKIEAIVSEMRRVHEANKKVDQVPTYESSASGFCRCLETKVSHDHINLIANLSARAMQDISYSASRQKHHGKCLVPSLMVLTTAQQDEIVEKIKDELEDLGINPIQIRVGLQAGMWLCFRTWPQPYIEWHISFTGTLPYLKLLTYDLESGGDLERLEFALDDRSRKYSWVSPDEKSYNKRIAQIKRERLNRK